jgi:hypothetical protein
MGSLSLLQQLHIHTIDDIAAGSVRTIEDLRSITEGRIKPLLQCHHAVVVSRGAIARDQFPFHSLRKVHSNAGAAQFHQHEFHVTLVPGEGTHTGTLLATYTDIGTATAQLSDTDEWKMHFVDNVRTRLQLREWMCKGKTNRYYDFLRELQRCMSGRIYEIAWQENDFAVIGEGSYHARCVRSQNLRGNEEEMRFNFFS